MKKTLNLIASIFSIILGIILGYCSFILYLAISIIGSSGERTAIELTQKALFGIDVIICIVVIILSIISVILIKKDIKWLKTALVIVLTILFISLLIVTNINNASTDIEIIILNFLLLVPIALEGLSIFLNQ